MRSRSLGEEGDEESEVSMSNRIAVIVGIDDYPVSPLSGCVRDAENLANLLEFHGDGSTNSNDGANRNFQIELITDTSSKKGVSKASLKSSINKLFRSHCDYALFYFAGHGDITDTGSYIVTPDHKKFDEGILMDEILLLANKSPAREKIIILDCCYSGSFGSPMLFGDSGLITLAEGVSILTASRSDEEASESSQGGAFTTLVLEALKGGAADLLGDITPSSIYAYVDRALGAYGQRPMFKSNVNRFVSLRTVSASITLVELRMLTEFFEKPDQPYLLSPNHEPTLEPQDKEKERLFGILQRMVKVNLVTPDNEEHMYYAAENSKSCSLTALGRLYWYLVKNNKV